MLGQFVGKITLWGVRLKLGKYVPDSGQEHTANGDDRFFVSASSFDSAVAFPKSGCFLEFIRALAICTRIGFRKEPARDILVDFIFCALLSLRGQQPAHETRCFDVGNTDISAPISDNMRIAVKGSLDKPGTVLMSSRATE